MRRRIPTMRAAAIPTVIAALALAVPSVTRAQAEQRVVVPLSEPGRPATLDVSTLMGSITVRASEGNEVVIVARDPKGGETRPDVRDDGLRRIRNTSIGLTAEERHNAVSIAVDWTDRPISLEIEVPRATSVHAATVNGGEILIERVEGNHELSNVNGGISAVDIAGSLVAGTTNGDVRVTFTRIAAGTPMSFTSFNGDVDVTFPPGLAADVRVNVGRGDLLTNLDLTIEPQRSRVEQSGDENRYRVRVERQIVATAGGGGPEMHFETYNGDVAIRRRR